MNRITRRSLMLGAVATPLIVLLLILSPGLARAQDTVKAFRENPIREKLESEIMCTCGCRMPMGSCQMRPNCGHYDQHSKRLQELLS